MGTQTEFSAADGDPVTSSDESPRPLAGTEAWHRGIIAAAVAVSHELTVVDGADAEAMLEVALTSVGEAMGLAAVGECLADAGHGVVWSNAADVAPEELDACCHELRALDQLDGPCSFVTAGGRSVHVVPNSRDGQAGSFFAMGADSIAFDDDSCRIFAILGGSLTSIRARVDAQRELREVEALEDRLGRLAERAATTRDHEDALDQILEAAHECLGVDSVSALHRTDSAFRFVASTEFQGELPLELGSKVVLSANGLKQLESPGFYTRAFSEMTNIGKNLRDTEGEALIVAQRGPKGLDGAVVFANRSLGTWTSQRINAARSVARSVQALRSRAEAEHQHRDRNLRAKLLTDVAVAAAQATLETNGEDLADALRLIVEHFDITSASMWDYVDGTLHRRLAFRNDSGLTAEPRSIELSTVDRRELTDRGFSFIRLTGAQIAAVTDDLGSLALVVPFGPELSGVLVFVDPDRHWSQGEISTAQALATLAHQTKARLDVEYALRERLRLEELVSHTAGRAIDITLDNVDIVLDSILADVVDFFGVTEASIWRFERDHMLCRSAHRDDGEPLPVGARIPLLDDSLFVERGWAVKSFNDLDLGSAVPADPLDSGLLITAYGGLDGHRGVLVLTDPSRPAWTDDHIAAARAVAATIGQIRVRLVAERELARRREVEQLLVETAAGLVEANLDNVREVVDGHLETFRAHFGISSVAVLELKSETQSFFCPCEITSDGLPLVAACAPISADNPAILRLVESVDPSDTDLAQLLGAEFDLASATSLVFCQVHEPDHFLLLAIDLDGRPYGADALVAFESLSILMAQLRRRLGAEHKAIRRASADRLVAGIAKLFVDQPPYEEHEEVVLKALGRVGEFFSCRYVSRWDLKPSGAKRLFGWTHPDSKIDITNFPDELPTDSSLVESVLANRPTTRELGTDSRLDLLANDTVILMPLAYDGAVYGVLSSVINTPKHLIADVDIHEDVLNSVARLIEQLKRRADADAEISRRLASEDLLRQFATQLLKASSDDSDVAEESFAPLMVESGVDHASIWRFTPDDDGFLVEPVFEAITGSVRRLPEQYSSVRLPAGVTTTRVLARAASEGSLKEEGERLQEMFAVVSEAGPRQVGFLPRAEGNPTEESSYLLISKPGDVAFRVDELEMFGSAHALLVQHEARIAAERWFSVAFESAPIGISMRDDDQCLIECNEAYEHLVGRTRDDLIGTRLNQVLTADVLDENTRYYGRGDGVDTETSYRRPDGSVVWGLARTSTVQVPGRREPFLLTYVEEITDRRRSREMLEYQATHDELTGLPNRRALVAEIAEELTRDRHCAVLLLDLDRFKIVNDSLGHGAGDQLLITCADRIRLSLRPGDSVCRLGGDEFAILLRAPADGHDAGIVAERLLSLLREPVTIGADEVFPSASIGIALPHREDDVVEDLLRHADAAMYQAKAKGRDCWEAFDESMRRAVVERIRTETDLRRAIDNGQLEVHYQPEFLLDTGEISSVEALVRWRHPERGLLAAGSFISVAEESGLVVDLGRWVLGQATIQAARWLAEGHDIMTRVNLSARQLRGAVVAEVEEALAAAGLAADRLCLELTETAIMDDVNESTRILAKFREMGVQIAIDDFGTGFSSLAYLKRFPVDILKIDRAFVDGVGVDPDDTAIVQSIVVLAHTLNLDVVAEGIEDATQVGELLRLGCNRGQGFHLARPAPADDVSMLLSTAVTRRD